MNIKKTPKIEIKKELNIFLLLSVLRFVSVWFLIVYHSYEIPLMLYKLQWNYIIWFFVFLAIFFSVLFSLTWWILVVVHWVTYYKMINWSYRLWQIKEIDDTINYLLEEKQNLIKKRS